MTRMIRIGSRPYRVAPPNIHDPRIHLSSVILTILVIGIGWLGFRVSIPQIALTLVTCAAMEVVWTYRRTAIVAWPASALQTATSTALLLRVIGTGESDYWSFHGWYVFVGVGAFSLLTKYTIRWHGANADRRWRGPSGPAPKAPRAGITAPRLEPRPDLSADPHGGHVFNPSNIGLIVAFLVLGSQRVEPLDFWWAPFGWPMVVAYAVIFFGGFWICGRLGLLGLSLSLWLSLAAGLGVVAAMGHSISARWSFAPISDGHFWWIILTSPEIFIFIFFMITDPKTVPAGRVARVVFGGAMGLVCTLLMTPWQTEFGAKVGLLSGLAVMCAFRPVLERRLPAAGSADDDLRRFAARLLLGEQPRVAPVPEPAPLGAGVARAARRRRRQERELRLLDLRIGPTYWRALVVRSVAGLAVIGLLGSGIAAAGTAAREPIDATPEGPAIELPGIDPASLPPVSVDRDVGGLSARLATPGGARDLAITLSQNLQIEQEAMATGDASLLPAIDDGQRLLDMQAAIAEGETSGQRAIPTYAFDSLHLVVVYPGGLQRGANAGLVATGTVTEVVQSVDGKVLDQTQRSFATTFSLRQTTAGRWLTTDTLVPRP